MLAKCWQSVKKRIESASMNPRKMFVIKGLKTQENMATLPGASWNHILECLKEFSLLRESAPFAFPRAAAPTAGIMKSASIGGARHSLALLESVHNGGDL
jgi:hypothetical protein